MGFRKKKSRRGLAQISVLHHKSLVAEQYRTIRTNIEFSSVQTHLRSILVTSSVPGEGKSFSAANLAAVFAQQEKKVLLVDADLRKPTIHETYQLENVQGLTNVLVGNASLGETVQKTLIDNLYVLTSGPTPPNPAELLSSKAMGELIQEMYSRYSLVIFDSPPLLAVADGQILANQTDGSVLVVLSGKTKMDTVQKARDALQQSKAKLLGALLNKKENQKNGALLLLSGAGDVSLPLSTEALGSAVGGVFRRLRCWSSVAGCEDGLNAQFYLKMMHCYRLSCYVCFYENRIS
ncbi:protein-tyrosine kinase [Bacillus velezensis AS43.3]|nr:protein-tyrosine kinase [Bacillus velezensis AS43.3]